MNPAFGAYFLGQIWLLWWVEVVGVAPRIQAIDHPGAGECA